jgi:hypothetical protein
MLNIAAIVVIRRRFEGGYILSIAERYVQEDL